MSVWRDKLPLPVWAMLLMFVFGVGVGLVLGVMLGEDDNETVIRHAEKDLPSVAEPITEKAADKGEGDKVKADEIAKPSVAPNDRRLFANLTPGPVKRSIGKALARMKPVLQKCVKQSREEKLFVPEKLALLIEFEAIGGMATVLGSDFLSENGDLLPIQVCLQKKLAGTLIDFRIQDGRYEVIEVFDVGKAESKPEKDGTKKQ